MSDAADPPSAVSDSEVGPASTTQPMAWFVITTCIFFIIKYAASTKATNADARGTSQKVWTAVYLLILITGEYFINLGTTKALCGNPQWSTTFYMTFGPWVLIFGVMNLMLLAFPGWLSPFSNTIGYGFAKLAGISSLMGDLFRFRGDGERGQAGQADQAGQAQTNEAAEILGRIYADKSLLINEITPESLDDFWRNMWPLFRPEVHVQSGAEGPDGDNPLKTRLRSLVILKDTVGLFCWYLLTGMLVTGVSYNYVMGSSCVKSAQQIEAAHDEFMREQQEVHAQKEAEGPPKVYKITGE